MEKCDKRMNTNQAVPIIINDMMERYRAVYGDALCKVYLYGSYARGDQHEDSDIDVVAIVRGNRAELQEKLKTVWEKSEELELEYEIIVSPTVIPFDEFEKYKDDLPYYRNIISEGIEIDTCL